MESNVKRFQLGNVRRVLFWSIRIINHKNVIRMCSCCPKSSMTHLYYPGPLSPPQKKTKCSHLHGIHGVFHSDFQWRLWAEFLRPPKKPNHWINPIRKNHPFFRVFWTPNYFLVTKMIPETLKLTASKQVWPLEK